MPPHDHDVPPIPAVLPLGPADAGELLTLQLAAWVREAHINDTLAIPPLHDTLDDVRGQLTDSAWTIVGLRRDGRLIGTVRTRLLKDDPTTAFLARLGVVPDLRGTGLGSVLLRHAESRLPDSVQRIELVTGARSEENIAFYEHHGYRVVGKDSAPGIVRLAKRHGRPAGSLLIS